MTATRVAPTSPWCPECREDPGACYRHDEAFRLCVDEGEAVHSGRAVALVRCYLCPGSPPRGVVREFTASVADPTAVLELAPCGHLVI